MMNLLISRRLVVMASFVTVACSAVAASFGEQKDVDYAASLWQMMAQANLVGDGAVLSKPYKGASPHGDFLDTLESSLTFNEHRGRVIVMRNYGGEGVSRTSVANEPLSYLNAITVMFKREAGYDPENKDWFWSQYSPSGEVMKNDDGIPLAGRVAKGEETNGCIACHRAASGGDMVFGNDRGVTP